MNRQYTRDDFLRLADQVHAAFDRPALTTDIIVGFPGESDPLFQETLDVVDRVGFLHIHAFPFSPRPGTAAARWKEDFIHGPVVNHRIDTLHQHADAYSHTFRQQFLGATVQLLVERPSPHDPPTLHHGRCERYFPVHFESSPIFPGVPVQVRITHVTPHQTLGTLIANLKSEI
jgi:threonylcarbamoyladenosine tRNA methylthiotransferase MtaB